MGGGGKAPDGRKGGAHSKFFKGGPRGTKVGGKDREKKWAAPKSGLDQKGVVWSQAPFLPEREGKSSK